MAQTVRDVIAECAAYPYSREHYELMKECSEIELMQQYLESQEFMADNHQYLTEGVTLSDGFLFEAESAESKEDIKKTIADKANHAWVKIHQGIAALIRKFWKLLDKLVGFASKKQEKLKEIHKIIAAQNYSDPEYQALGDELLNIVKDAYAGQLSTLEMSTTSITGNAAVKIEPMPESEAQSIESAFGSMPAGKRKDVTKLYWSLVAPSAVWVLPYPFKQGFGAVSPDIICKVAASLLHGNENECKSALDLLKNECDTAAHAGMAIPVGKENLQRTADQLKKLSETIDKAEEARLKKVDDNTGNDLPEGERAEAQFKAASAAMNSARGQLHTACVSCIGATMTLYSDVATARNKAFGPLSEFAKKLQDMKKQTPAETDTAEEKPAENQE